MPETTVDDVRIHFEASGDEGAEPIVLLGGAATQLIDWRDGFCDLLGAEGFRVVRLDHRDTGLSQRFGGPRDVDGGYDLADMAEDVVRVLDTLGLASAHVAGHSMGGIVAQYLVLGHPERVRSLALISTIPGVDPGYLVGPQPTAADLRPVPRLPRALAVRQFVATQRAMHAPAFEFDVADERAHAARLIDRGYEPNAFLRHWSAMLRASDRLGALRRVSAPTAVIHGREDGVLRWRAAELTAQAIPQAELHVLDRMGHRVERALWPEYVALIARNARRAGAVRA